MVKGSGVLIQASARSLYSSACCLHAIAQLAACPNRQAGCATFCMHRKYRTLKHYGLPVLRQSAHRCIQWLRHRLGHPAAHRFAHRCLASNFYCCKVKANAAQASINTGVLRCAINQGSVALSIKHLPSGLTSTLNADAKSWACLRHLMPSFWYPAALRASGAG